MAGIEWRRLPWELRYRRGSRLMSRLRQLSIKLTHQHCTVSFQGPVQIGPGFRLLIPDRGSLIIGPSVEFRREFTCEIYGDGRVTIGGGSVFTDHALIQCTTTIDIGERCAMGQSLMIADGKHRFRDPSVPMLQQGYDFTPIHIADDVTVMSKCTIFSDIGTHAVIGANSVVSRPVPAYTLAVGAPARPIEYFGPPELRPPGLDA